MIQRWCLILCGVVQGIGLRPFVFQLAQKYKLTGSIHNTNHNVTLHWQGMTHLLTQALADLNHGLKEFGDVSITKQLHSIINETNFLIRESQGSGGISPVISPDLAICASCLNELYTKSNRRFQYPFITCAQCGPRYSICHSLPYDRHRTSMMHFEMCDACKREYQDPTSRRFHAQTISCPECGPTLSLHNKQGTKIGENHEAVNKTVDALKQGKIIAIKGIGGFHLVCLATNYDALLSLRQRKNRPDKPFALMVKDIAQAHELCELNADEHAAMIKASAPIVIALKISSSAFRLCEAIAPNQTCYGMMLAYTPLHHLLLNELNVPLVATSGNNHSEPICYDNNDALSCLNEIADLWLWHDRDIVRPIEDSITRYIDGKMRVIRRARGMIPFALKVSPTNNPCLALGGHLKNSIALYCDQNIHTSPYIGDLTSLKSIQRFHQSITEFQKISPIANIITDMHDDYHSSIEAKHLSQTQISVPHHYAHVFAVMAEHQLLPPILGFAWDGLGLGENRELWGGETFVISQDKIHHSATLFPITLLGGEKAIKEPRRIALSLLYTIYQDNIFEIMDKLQLSSHFSEVDLNLLISLLKNPISSMHCSSVGRLFDGICALLNICQVNTFEGHAAMQLEQLGQSCKEKRQPFSLSLLIQDQKIIIDWRPLIIDIINELTLDTSKAAIAHQFHLWCANVIYEIAEKFNYQTIILGGGVFQNQLLTDLAATKLRSKGYKVYCCEQIPSNDSGLAVGQAYATQLINTKYSQPCV